MRAVYFSAMIAFAVQVFAAEEADLEAFRDAMIDRDCEFASSAEGQEVREKLSWEEAKFSDVMMQLTIAGEFQCPSGCQLINDACP